MPENKVDPWALFKVRLEIGMSFLSIVNFLLLSITSSDKIQEFIEYLFGINIHLGIIIPVMVLLTFPGVYFVGHYLDTRFKYLKKMYEIASKNNPQQMEILENTRQIKEVLECGSNKQR